MLNKKEYKQHRLEQIQKKYSKEWAKVEKEIENYIDMCMQLGIAQSTYCSICIKDFRDVKTNQFYDKYYKKYFYDLKMELINKIGLEPQKKLEHDYNVIMNRIKNHMENEHCETVNKFIEGQEDLMKEKGIKFERVYNNDKFAGWRIEAEKIEVEEYTIKPTMTEQSKENYKELLDYLKTCTIDPKVDLLKVAKAISNWGIDRSKTSIVEKMKPLQHKTNMILDDSKVGIKESDGKLNYELDWNFIEQIAQRMSQNKGKYPPYNWKRPMDVEKLKQSLLRHTIEIMKGNYSDDGRELGHLESVALNAMMINYQLNNPHIKYKKEDFTNK